MALMLLLLVCTLAGLHYVTALRSLPAAALGSTARLDHHMQSCLATRASIGAGFLKNARFSILYNSGSTATEAVDAHCVQCYKLSREFSLSVMAFIALDLMLKFTRGFKLAPSASLAASLASLSLMSVAAIISDVLRAAGQRRRLSASTFKKLNLGLLFSCVPLMFSESCRCVNSAVHAIGGLLAAGGTTPHAPALPVLLPEVVAPLWTVLFAGSALSGSYSALQQYGLPELKAHYDGPLQVTYLLLGGLAILLGGVHLLYLPRLLPCESLRFALLPMVMLSLNNAAFAGQKRLSSATYQSLNTAVFIESIAVLSYYGVSGVWRRPGELSLQLRLRLLMRILQIGAAAVGLYRGKTYQSEGEVVKS